MPHPCRLTPSCRHRSCRKSPGRGGGCRSIGKPSPRPVAWGRSGRLSSDLSEEPTWGAWGFPPLIALLNFLSYRPWTTSSVLRLLLRGIEAAPTQTVRPIRTTTQMDNMLSRESRNQRAKPTCFSGVLGPQDQERTMALIGPSWLPCCQH